MLCADEIMSSLEFFPKHIFIDTLIIPTETLEEGHLQSLYKSFDICPHNIYTTIIRLVRNKNGNLHHNLVICDDCLFHLNDILLGYKEMPYNYHKRQYPCYLPFFERRIFVGALDDRPFRARKLDDNCYIPIHSRL